MACKAEKKHKKLLLITSSGGEGHLQAAYAQKLKILNEDPHTEVVQKDILVDLVGKRFGKSFVFLWNISQKKGYLSILRFLSRNIPAADFCFYMIIFPRVLYALIKEDIDQVIDTQPIGTPSIIQAIKWACKITRKPLKLEKVVTELPTEQVLHFFKPIKSLNPNNRNFLKLISMSPLLNHNQTAEAFWQKNCGLSEQDVYYDTLPLRPAFRTFQNLSPPKHKSITIKIQLHSAEERMLITHTLNKGMHPNTVSKDTVTLTIKPRDHVATILLGSQPAEDATLKYVSHYITMIRNTKTYKNHLLFVFCTSHIPHKSSLLTQVHDLIRTTRNYPTNLTIIPMGFQEDTVIAPLYYRSQATFTRSGGLTSMELMSVAHGQIWIHSEVKESLDTLNQSIGMPIWEWGNAIYLKQKKGAKFIHPDTFLQVYTPH